MTAESLVQGERMRDAAGKYEGVNFDHVDTKKTSTVPELNNLHDSDISGDICRRFVDGVSVKPLCI